VVDNATERADRPGNGFLFRHWSGPRIFADSGAKAVINYASNREGAEKVLRSIETKWRNALVVKADVSMDKERRDNHERQSIAEDPGIRAEYLAGLS